MCGEERRHLPGQALVKLITSGVCHTDLHAVEGDWPVKPNPPFIPGHEGVGEVVALGEGVTNLTVGQLVGNAWLFSACGHCQYCNIGWETLCEAQQNAGYSVDGSFGEYMLVDAKFAAIIPDGADLVEVAPILCAGVTVYKGLKMTGGPPGQWVVISGIGGLGHIAVQYAKAMGLRVAAVDIADDKLALAKKHGAELLVNARQRGPDRGRPEGDRRRPRRPGHRRAPLGVRPGDPHVTRRGGTIVFNGLPAGDFPASIFEIVLKGLTVRGSIVGTRQDLVEALEFYARGEIHPTVSTRTLGEINDVLRRDEARQDRRPRRHQVPDHPAAES